MRIAIVGAGYAGMAAAYFLSQKGWDVTVFGIDGGGSWASTGLLHPAPGRKAVPCWRAEEGMQASLELLKRASHTRPVFLESGLVRLVGDQVLWVPEGVTVFSRLYLEELRKICPVTMREIVSERQLEAFDRTILACGSVTHRFIDWPLKKTIGQSLLCRWDKPLAVALLGEGHITPTEDARFCQVGSTYEHTEAPDPKKAEALLEAVASFYPPARDFEIVEVRSGVRVAPKTGYRPIVEQVGAKTWLFTGLGSRGLLYHALLAKELADRI